MLAAAILSAALLLAQTAAQPACVEQDVELVAVHHIADGSEFVGFFAFVQDSWTMLDHRCGRPDWSAQWAGDRWTFFFDDDSDGCYRVIRARCWVECWSDGDPRRSDLDGPWFVRLLEPGLAQPPRAEQ